MMLGVTVVLAHAASLGRNQDFDHPGEDASNFELLLSSRTIPATEVACMARSRP